MLLKIWLTGFAISCVVIFVRVQLKRYRRLIRRRERVLLWELYETLTQTPEELEDPVARVELANRIREELNK